MHNVDHYKYINEQWKVENIRYGNGVTKVYKGYAIYLPKQLYETDNLFGNIIKFISDNNDTISNIAAATSSVVDSSGKVGSTVVDTIKKHKWIKI